MGDCGKLSGPARSRPVSGRDRSVDGSTPGRGTPTCTGPSKWPNRVRMEAGHRAATVIDAEEDF